MEYRVVQDLPVIDHVREQSSSDTNLPGLILAAMRIHVLIGSKQKDQRAAED